jgi:hypothetical protein
MITATFALSAELGLSGKFDAPDLTYWQASQNFEGDHQLP